jgi:Arc/MetJ-type ribon-helix-helix transcriptional regulator
MGEPITVRLGDALAVQLRSLATFDRVSLADEIREAVGLLIEARQGDAAYRERVRAAFEEARQALVALDDTDGIIAALGDPLEERHTAAESALVGAESREVAVAGR